MTCRSRSGGGSGFVRRPPSESALRRVLQLLDPHLLDSTVSGWQSADSSAIQVGRMTWMTARSVVSPSVLRDVEGLAGAVPILVQFGRRK